MKKFFLAFIMFFLSGSAYAEWPMDCCIPGRIHYSLSEEWVLEQLAFDKEHAKKEGFEYCTAWGHEWRGENTDAVFVRNFFLVSKPRKIAPRVWAMPFLDYKLINEKWEPIYKPDSITTTADCQDHPDCNVKGNSRYFVVPKGSKDFNPDELKPSDFTIFTAKIDKFKLVWLYDFLELIMETEPGEFVELDGISLNNWGDEDYFYRLDELRDSSQNWHIKTVTTTTEGYEVSFCRFLEKERECLNWEGEIYIFLDFVSTAEVEIRDIIGIVP